MKQITAGDIKVFDIAGNEKGFVTKYYKYGLWHYRAILFKSNGILSANFYTLENAKQYILENS